jgi:hypothetical protein
MVPTAHKASTEGDGRDDGERAPPGTGLPAEDADGKADEQDRLDRLDDEDRADLPGHQLAAGER